MTEQSTTPDPAPAWPPMRFVGWSVDRVDGSSSFGTFDRRESAGEWCERLRGYGNDVHVVRYEVPDEMAVLSGLLRRMARGHVHLKRFGGKLAEQVDELRAELARVRPVVDAARAYVGLSGTTPMHEAADALQALYDALTALDAPATPTPQPAAFVFRYAGERRTGQPVDLGRDLGTVEALIAEAPADYPGLGLLYRRREELIDQIRAGAERSTACFIAGCDNTEIDERGPVCLRDGTQHQACTDHWEGIFRVLGEQVSWERDAMRTTPSTDTTPGGDR